MSEWVTINSLPLCNFCQQEGTEQKAEYDFKTRMGPWANGCKRHWKQYRAYESLGTGMGQQLILRR